VNRLKQLFAEHRHQVVFVLEMVILISGAFVAYLTVYRFQILVRAILGLTIHYLFYLEYFVFRRTQDSKLFFHKFEFPKDIRYFVLDFFVVIVLIWASVQIVDLFRYLVSILINS